MIARRTPLVATSGEMPADQQDPTKRSEPTSATPTITSDPRGRADGVFGPDVAGGYRGKISRAVFAGRCAYVAVLSAFGAHLRVRPLGLGDRVGLVHRCVISAVGGG